ASDGRLIGLHHLVEDLARTDRLPAGARHAVHVARDAEEPLDRVEEPGLAAHREVEPRVAVGDDVEAGLLLLPDDAAHGVQVLLAEARVAERLLEGPTPQHL